MNEDIEKSPLSNQQESIKGPSESSKNPDPVSPNSVLRTSVIQSQTPSSSSETPPSADGWNKTGNNDLPYFSKDALAVSALTSPMGSKSDVILINDSNQIKSSDHVSGPEIKDDTEL